MKLEWMGQHRDLVETVIRFGNRYAGMLKKRFAITGEVSMSMAEIQVLEYILENEELKLNMAATARRLGISASLFTKIAAKLEKMGLLDKYHMGDNKKDIILLVSDYGKQVYMDYVNSPLTDWMKTMSDMLQGIPQKYIQQFEDIIEVSIRAGGAESEPKQKLKPIGMDE